MPLTTSQFVIGLISALFTLSSSQTISYLTCATNADCLHYEMPVCTGTTCQQCASNTDCQHLDATSQCLTSGTTKYCSVPCASTTSAGVCGPINSLCQNLGSGNRCGSCMVASDCSSQYPTGVQCHTINGIGYCGYCLDDYQCSTGQTCRNFKCTECLNNAGCPTTRPVCSITLKSNVCKCTSNADCPASKPTCTKISSTSVEACYSVPTMSLAKGSVSGTVVMTFTKQMISTKSMDEILDIEIVNVSSDLFTYSIIQIDAYTYQLSITANTNIYSPQLTVTIKQADDLVDADGLSLLQTSYSIQLDDLYLYPSSHQKPAENSAEMATVLIIFILCSSLLVLFIRGDSIIFWILVNFMQSIYYLLFVNIEYPMHLQMFLHPFYIATFRFLPSFLTLISDAISIANLPAPERFQKNSINGLFLVNIGHLIFYWLIAITFACMILLIEKFVALPKSTEAFLSKIRKYLLWSGMIRVLLASFNEFSFAGFLQMRVLYFDSAIHIASSLLGILATVLVSASPLLFLFLLKRYRGFSGADQEKYGQLVDEYKPENRLGRYFLSITVARRLIMCVLITFFPQSPLAVVLGLIALNVTSILLLGLKPHKKPINNFLTTVLEVISIFTHLLALSLVIDDYDGQPEGEIRIWTAWGIIGILLSSLLVGAAFTFFEICNSLRNLLCPKIKGPNRARLAPVIPKIGLNNIVYSDSHLPKGTKILNDSSFTPNSSKIHDFEEILSNSRMEDSSLNLVRGVSFGGMSSNSHLSLLTNSGVSHDESTFGKAPIAFKPLKPVHLTIKGANSQGQSNLMMSRHLTPRSGLE